MKKTIVSAVSTAALLSTVFAGTVSAATYNVQKGDSLSKIASKYHTNVNTLKSLNQLKSDALQFNQKLKLPGTSFTVQSTTPKTYTVKKGDILAKIASHYKISLTDLQQWNKLGNEVILPGQVLKLAKPAQAQPVKKTSTPSASSSTPTEYVIKSGDSLSKIAVKFHTSVEALKSLNKMRSDAIYVGEKLKVSTSVKPTEPPTKNPSKNTDPVPDSSSSTVQNVTSYTIKSGDTLGGIATQFGMTTQQLKSLNKLTSDNIFVGQTLKVAAAAQTNPTHTDPASAPHTDPTPADMTNFVTQLINAAKSVIGTPYVWGGSDISGFDCSGFIYYIANKAGLNIGRYTAEGYYSRTHYVDKPQTGDLVFFENTYKQGISHVGVYLSNNQFIHADENLGVSIGSLDNSYFKQHFDGFKRFY